MADNSWAERRGRMVKCKAHGLHYDPEMSTGCTLCMRNTAKERPTRPPQLVLILLCLLGMAAILFYLFGPGQEETASVNLGVASKPETATPKLDPEPYREPVETLETALFRTSLDETEDLLVVSGDIRSSARDLSAAILQAEPVDGLTAADLIARMGQAIPIDQVMLSDVQRARDQWLRIRIQRFLSADWFSQPTAAEARSTDSSAADYSDVAASLGTLIEDGIAGVEALSDPDTPSPGEDDPAIRWRNFARGWLAELDSLASRLPARPDAGADAELLVAIQDLEQALSLARTLASSTQPPSVNDTRFDDAIGAALRAQQGFDDLLE